MAELAELLERVKAETGPDRELDIAIGLAVGGFERVQRGILGVVEYRFWMPEGGWNSGSSTVMIPKFTASLDAALALVERALPGAEWSVGHNACDDFVATCWVQGVEDLDYHAPTAALALLAALLSALIAQAAETAVGSVYPKTEDAK